MKRSTRIAIHASAVALILAASFMPELISGHSPYSISLSGALKPGAHNLCGTDYLGRDILSRTLAGARLSVLIGIASRFASMALGLIVGLVAGMGGPALRLAVNSAIEVFLSVPSLLLALALAMVLGEGYLTVIISITAGTWAPVARIVSAKIASIRQEDFVLSARAVGAGYVRIAVRHIIPALMPLLIPLATTGIAASIMMESTLSFLGLAGGSSLDALPSWGIMIQEGSKFIFDAPWIIIPPSIMLTVLILAFNQIGDLVAVPEKARVKP